MGSGWAAQNGATIRDIWSVSVQQIEHVLTIVELNFPRERIPVVRAIAAIRIKKDTATTATAVRYGRTRGGL